MAAKCVLAVEGHSDGEALTLCALAKRVATENIVVAGDGFEPPGIGFWHAAWVRGL